ncbi:hypothetical protein K456DRAFT_1762135 [Colletotrichum gloeosporioides 23]|nr:hypothetical protein K456DRAFT_1762135 [Colletotrichum gloeosporioides 23]
MGSFRSVAAPKWLDSRGRAIPVACCSGTWAGAAGGRLLWPLTCNGLAVHSTLVSTTPQSGHPSQRSWYLRPRIRVDPLRHCAPVVRGLPQCSSGRRGKRTKGLPFIAFEGERRTYGSIERYWLRQEVEDQHHEAGTCLSAVGTDDSDMTGTAQTDKGQQTDSSKERKPKAQALEQQEVLSGVSPRPSPPRPVHAGRPPVPVLPPRAVSGRCGPGREGGPFPCKLQQLSAPICIEVTRSAFSSRTQPTRSTQPFRTSCEDTSFPPCRPSPHWASCLMIA